MANGIKIGSLNIDSLKVGSGDCSIYLGSTLLYPQNQPHNYANDYLTFVAEEDGTFKFSNSGMSYSIDSGSTWVILEKNTNTPTVSSGNTILFKRIYTSLSMMGTFSSSGRFIAQGNSMSIVYGDDFSGQTSLSGKDYVLYLLFSSCSKLTSAENLILPATTLSNYCYQYMFQDCTSLITAPELPSTTLEISCYSYMFEGCTSLTTAPQLPATTLAINCYNSMFNGCTSLTAAPQLPATTLTQQCYYHMFGNCTSLTTVPILSATTLAQQCYQLMFENCASLTTLPNGMLPSTTLANTCYNGMFNGCSGLTSVPSDLLPATTLINSCYSYMFYGCTSLTTAPILSATTLSNFCYNAMFKGCINLSNITCLATDTSATYSTFEWVKNVASSGTFAKEPSMSSWESGNNGIPSNWTVVDYSS